MKKTLLSLFILIAFSLNTLAQDSPQWFLPKGAKARFGKGIINKIAYSPDSTRLAVASSIGIWMHDTNTGETLDLLAPNTWVVSMSFSPDGQILATGNRDGNVRLWHATTGDLLQTIPGHPSLSKFFSPTRNSVVFSPNGNSLAVGSRDNTVFLWNVNTGKQLHTFIGHTTLNTGTAASISFSPDGKILASSSSDFVDGKVKASVILWDVNTGNRLQTLTGHGDRVYSISFSPNGKILASSGSDFVDGKVKASVILWDVNTGNRLQTLTGHGDTVYSISFSPDGTMLASGSRDRTIKLWAVATGKELRTLTGHGNNVYSVSFSPDGTMLASGSLDRTVRLWDVDTGDELQTLTGRRAVFSPDGNTLAAWSSNRVLLWDTNTGETLQELTGHHSLYNVSFSPDGNTLAYLRGGNEVQLRNVNTDKLKNFTGTRWVLDPHTGVTTGFSPNVYSIAFTPDGNTLAIGGNWIISLLNTNTGETIHNFTDIACRIESVAISPNGNTLAGGGSDSIVRLWDIKTNTQREMPTGQYGDIKVAFSPDGNTLATVPDIGGQVRLWDVNTGKQLQEFTADGSGLVRIYSVAFSPDGNTLATGSRDYNHGKGWFGTVTLWDVNTGKTLQTLTGHTSGVSSISFSPDGSKMATGSQDGTLKLWDVNTGKTRQTLIGHTSSVSSISFSPDGSTLATGGGGTVLLWKIRSDGLLPVEPEGKQLAKWGFIKSTGVFQNYPNPFNPETWIPYQLAKPANVTLSIYAEDGKVVRTLKLGNMPAGKYQSRSRAAHWDGRNAVGEPVASGVYFYTLTADDFTATRKLLIRK